VKAYRLNYLRLSILSTFSLLLVSVLPQVHAAEKHITTEKCEACQASSTPKAIENLIPEICSATLMLTSVAPNTIPEKSMAIIQDVSTKQDSLIRVGSKIPSIGTVKKVREKQGDLIVLDDNNQERRFPKFCTPSNKDMPVAQVQSAQASPTRTTSNGSSAAFTASASSGGSATAASSSQSDASSKSDSSASNSSASSNSSDTGQSNIKIGNSTFTNTEIKKEEFEQYSQNITKLAAHARASRLLDEKGQPAGIEISNVTDDGFYKKYLGLENGDRILKVNDTQAHSPAMMLNMVRMLQNGESIKVHVLRNGADTVVIGARVGK
jgi:hypothetical protein